MGVYERTSTIQAVCRRSGGNKLSSRCGAVNMAQLPLTAAIQRIEDEVGTTLIERTTGSNGGKASVVAGFMNNVVAFQIA